MTIAVDVAFILGCALIGGVVHSFAIAKNLWPAARIPLDGGVTWRGKRLFGDNKTVRGAIIMILTTTGASLLLSQCIPVRWLSSFPMINQPASALQLGFFIGLSYILGELPNSFIKRQANIPPGQLVGGRGKMWSYFYDQADSVIGVCLILGLLYHLPLVTLLAVLVLGTVIHLLFDRGLYILGVKKRETLITPA